MYLSTVFDRVLFRLDRLLAELAGSSTFSGAEGSVDCSARNRTIHSTSFHLWTNSSRFSVSDPHQSPVRRPWYNNMLANRVHRLRTHGERGTKYGRDMIPLAPVSNHLQDVWKLWKQLQVKFITVWNDRGTTLEGPLETSKPPTRRGRLETLGTPRGNVRHRLESQKTWRASRTTYRTSINPIQSPTLVQQMTTTR